MLYSFIISVGVGNVQFAINEDIVGCPISFLGVVEEVISDGSNEDVVEKKESASS
jgi:hypothetical protein